jgi:glycosyltransferase involved in cell wall biosynthesis
MTVTEAAACGTPAVVTRIAGHIDAVAEDHSGLLASNQDELRNALDRVLSDEVLRERLAAGALDHASKFTWAATARGTLEVLAAEAMLRRRRR